LIIPFVPLSLSLKHVFVDFMDISSQTDRPLLKDEVVMIAVLDDSQSVFINMAY